MCFSASASFGAGVVLTVIGIAAIRKVQHPSHLPFAAIPLIFAIQQITEGFVWLAHLNENFAVFLHPSTVFFIFIAQVVWPFWVPFAIYKLDAREGKSKLLGKIALGIGTLVSLYLAYCLFTIPIHSTIEGHHVTYIQHYPEEIGRYCGFLYIVSTIAPPFLSNIRNLWLLGLTILISYLITTIFYTQYVVSVWCFFASLISFTVLLIIHQLQKSEHQVV